MTAANLVVAGKSKAHRLMEQHTALQLRRAGYTFADIGMVLGVSDETASRRVSKALTTLVAQEAGELRAQEEDRFDLLLREAMAVLHEAKARGDLPAILASVESIRRIEESRIKLLGLALTPKAVAALEYPEEEY